MIPARGTKIVVSRPSDEGRLGPCMQALTERQRKFVWAMLDTGGVNYMACAQAAGYSDPGGNSSAIRVTGHRLAHDEQIQAAIQEEARKRMGAGVIMATGHLVNIANNPAHKDQLSAIKELLNRAGLHAITEQRVSVQHSVDRAGMLREIGQIADSLGMDPKKLLGHYGVAVDAEFQEVEEEFVAPSEDDDLGDIL